MRRKTTLLVAISRHYENSKIQRSILPKLKLSTSQLSPPFQHGIFTRALTVRVQAYGGGVSIYFGSYVWSTSSFNGESTCSAGATNVLGLSAVFENCSFSSSSALTSAVQGKRVQCDHVVPF